MARLWPRFSNAFKNTRKFKKHRIRPWTSQRLRCKITNVHTYFVKRSCLPTLFYCNLYSVVTFQFIVKENTEKQNLFLFNKTIFCYIQSGGKSFTLIQTSHTPTNMINTDYSRQCFSPLSHRHNKTRAEGDCHIASSPAARGVSRHPPRAPAAAGDVPFGKMFVKKKKNN